MTQSATVTALPTGRVIEKCRQPGTDPDAWFPPEPKPEHPHIRPEYEEKAHDLCRGCPLTQACLQQALADESRPGVERHGVYGGLAPWEREEIATLELAVA
jgi:hypothetical protein